MTRHTIHNENEKGISLNDKTWNGIGYTHNSIYFNINNTDFVLIGANTKRNTDRESFVIDLDENYIRIERNGFKVKIKNLNLINNVDLDLEGLLEIKKQEKK